ncbi:molybdopterin molybdotransferase MoeA [Promicromonospora sukumoe]|uniref:Molybdopterin molybdenumtransferase n=1 Tax=Promicromonospora sukumoe TaxID=88382 RepID=A0A7W3JE24_9MICO|nr:gephyrin-like molybdotransferase Glp [Promicromonospora sukumoe]MBA8811128.1 molybdopterin molybdotransferase [Promicromonospora sukumoe]
MESRLRSVTEHVEHVLALVEPLPAVASDLVGADGAVLAEDLYARVSVPPFESAAMDGYAVRLADLPADGAPVTLRVTGDVAAGAGPAAREGIGPGEAVRIMTGAPLPPGADAVVPVEHTSTGRFVAGASRAESAVTLARRPRAHVRAAGEDVTEGELLARAGSVVTAATVGALVASGTVRVPVRRRPLVAVISTGAELVPAGGGLGPGQITDSNGPMLAAAARAAGADVVRPGPVPDDPDALRAALDVAVRASGVDLIVTAGGVSAGAADVVREVLAASALGAGGVTDADVATVAMSPGKPQALARWRGAPWLALPGNPVGAYASFELFVRPAIDRLRGLGGSGEVLLSQGGNAEPAVRAQRYLPGRAYLSLRTATAWSSPAGRLQALPVRVVDGAIEPAGSHHSLAALAGADGLALVPPDVEKVRAGDVVQVLMLR